MKQADLTESSLARVRFNAHALPRLSAVHADLICVDRPGVAQPLAMPHKNAVMLVTLPDGIVVHAQGRLGLIPSERSRQPDFAVYLDERWNRDPDVTWPYLMIDWPDFGLPRNEADLFATVLDIRVRANAGELVEIACYGGVGRTGTVLCCLAVRAGIDHRDAVEWVREHYDRRAVETPEQQQLVERFAGSR